MRQGSKGFLIYPRLACVPKDFVCLLWLGFRKVILMVNIEKVNIIVFVFHFHACGALNFLDRLLFPWQQHGNFFRPLTFGMWGSSVQPPAESSCFYTQVEAADAVRLAQRGWRRLGQDCRQMLFWRPTAYLKSGCWAYICQAPALHRMWGHTWGHVKLTSCLVRLPCQVSTKWRGRVSRLTPKTATFHSSIDGNKENNSVKLITFDLILLMKSKTEILFVVGYFVTQISEMLLKGISSSLDIYENF